MLRSSHEIQSAGKPYGHTQCIYPARSASTSPSPFTFSFISLAKCWPSLTACSRKLACQGVALCMSRGYSQVNKLFYPNSSSCHFNFKSSPMCIPAAFVWYRLVSSHRYFGTYILLPSLQSQHLLSWVCYRSALVVGHSQEGTWGMRKRLHSRKGRGVGAGIVQSCVLYSVRPIKQTKHQSSGYSFTITVKQEAKRGCRLPGIPFPPNRTAAREGEVDTVQTGTIIPLQGA